MNTTMKFDRVILTKELNDKFHKVGEVFEVADIFSNSFLLRDAKSKIALGVVSFEDFERCFVCEENYKGWTSWTQFVGGYGENNIAYRTNGKKTQVKGLTDRIVGESCCNKTDEFVLTKGIYIAYMRYLIKSFTAQKNELEEKLKVVNDNLIENKTILKKMINSLGK